MKGFLLFLLGTFVGGVVGVVTMCLMTIAKENDKLDQ